MVQCTFYISIKRHIFNDRQLADFWIVYCSLPLKPSYKKHYSYYISVSTRIRYSFYCAPRSWSPLFITLSGTSYTMNQTAYQFFIGCADTTFTIERSWTFQQCLHFLVIRGKVNVSKLCIKIILVNSVIKSNTT